MWYLSKRLQRYIKILKCIFIITVYMIRQLLQQFFKNRKSNKIYLFYVIDAGLSGYFWFAFIPSSNICQLNYPRPLWCFFLRDTCTYTYKQEQRQISTIIIICYYVLLFRIFSMDFLKNYLCNIINLIQRLQYDDTTFQFVNFVFIPTQEIQNLQYDINVVQTKLC